MSRGIVFLFAAIVAAVLVFGCRTPSSDGVSADSSGAAGLIGELDAYSKEYKHVDRDPSGNVVSLVLPSRFLTKSNVKRVASIPTLKGLTAFGGGEQYGVFRIVPRLTNLTSLRLNCFIRTNDPALRQILPAVSQMQNLRELTLYGVFVPAAEYRRLGQMTNLTSLKIIFGKINDREVPVLTNLVNLRSLHLTSVDVSTASTNLLGRLPLTNFVFQSSLRMNGVGRHGKSNGELRRK